jgi:hypothetical protein
MRATTTIVLALLLAACGRRAAGPGGTGAAPAGPAIERTARSGPVTVTVRVSPEKPTLGDPVTLELIVEAEAGVEVRLPDFGEALGRFTILDFAPSRQTTAAGGTRAVQRYTLRPPMSGQQKIPGLLVEFDDRRPGQPDAGPGGGGELTSEDITLDVQSIDAEGALAGKLRPPRGPLPEEIPTLARSSRLWIGIGAAAALLIAGAALAWVVLARRRRRGPTAFAVAEGRLAALEARGFPSAAQVDPWYVELSDIVRRYLEERFAVRAPELTTEEFLREVGRSEALAPPHRVLLGSFLERCDRVKFAGYQPAEGESREALQAARRFLLETRPTPEEAAR